MVAINVSAQHATNLLLPGEYETLTQDDIKDRIYGSKVVILLEQAMLICTWLTKACMLLLYHRLASRLPHQFVIKCIAVYVAFGFVAVELAWFLSCRPLYGYWMLPVPHCMSCPMFYLPKFTADMCGSSMRNVPALLDCPGGL